MKTTQTITHNTNTQEYVIRLRKKKFPWLILLLPLLLLLLLIPIPQDIDVQVFDAKTLKEIHLANVNSELVQDAETKTDKQETDEKGKTSTASSYSFLYEVLFIENTASVAIDASKNGYRPEKLTGNYAELQKELQIIRLEPIIETVIKFIVVDSITRKLLPNIEVEVSNDKFSGKKNTDNQGETTFADVTINKDMNMIVYARDDKYENVRKSYSVKQQDLTDTIAMLSIDNGGMRGERGEINVNLKWETEDDLDLIVVTPCNDTIYFQNPEKICDNSKGQLDIDANIGPDNLIDDPQENIFWDKASVGKYQIFVLCYKKRKRNKVNYVITLIHNDKRTIFNGSLIKSGEVKQVHNFVN